MIEGSSGNQTGGGADLTFSAELHDNVSPTADQIEKRLKALGASRHEIKMFLTAYDQATPKIKAAQEQLNKLPKDHLTNLRVNADSVDQAHTKLQRLKDLAKTPITFTLKAEHDLGDSFNKFKMKIPQMELQLRNALHNMPLTAGLLGATGAAYNAISGPISTMSGLPFSSMGAGAAGVGAAGAMGAFFSQSFSQNARLEQNMAQLTQILRTPAAAQQAYGQVIHTATTTPFNMPDVLQSYIRMAQMGTNPNNPAYGIKAAANLAAGGQVPISHATGALQNASQGYFTELNNISGRNIRQSDFTYGGRYSGDTYQQAVTQVLKQYQNASQTQMQTFKGLMTNIQDIIQQKVTTPAGAPLFGAAKGIEQQTAANLNQPGTQAALSREVDKLQQGLIKVFQLVQQGGAFFKSSLETPLKAVATNIMSVGKSFSEAFGGTVVTGVKYLGLALAAVVQPLSTIARTVGNIPLPLAGSVAGLMGFTKAMHLFGMSANTGLGNITKGFATINPIRIIEGLKQASSLIAKLSLFSIIKSFLDMKNANDQLSTSFQKLGSQGQDSLSNLKTRFDELIFRATALGKSVAELKVFGGVAGTIVGTNKSVDPSGKILGQAEYRGGYDMAKLSSATGMSNLATEQAFQVWGKQMKVGQQVYDTHNPQKVFDTLTAQIYQAGRALQKSIGGDLPNAIQQATVALKQFGSQLSSAGMATPRGASIAAALFNNLNQPSGMSAKDSAKFGGATGLVGSLLSSAVAPGTDVLKAALGHGSAAEQARNLAKSFTFNSNRPNAPGAGTADILSVLHQYQNVPLSAQRADAQMQRAMGPGGAALGIHLPQFQNVLPGLGISQTGAQVKSMNTQQSAQEILKLQGALTKASAALAATNQQITNANDALSKWGIVTEQASAALANFSLHGRVMGQNVEHLQNATDQWSLSLQKLQTSQLDPLQRAIAAVGQQMANYQQYSIVPIQRSQEDWNQVMTLTSNKLDDVSNSLRVAQYNMQLYNGGMLKGENALNAQIEALTIYNTKLDELRLQNMGLQADISKTQFHNGFTSTVRPLMGFDLSREIQLGQQRQQMMQDQQAVTYGAQHYQLGLAARTVFQKQEMSFGQRMKGTLQAASVLSTGQMGTEQIQNLQYQEQLKARLLQEAMYAATIKERPLQDQQFRLNQKAFYLQQKMSVASDKIATATEAIAQGQLPIQHDINHINSVAQVASAKIDKHLFKLNDKQGALTNVITDIHGLFGDFSKNFNNNIRKGGRDTLLNHLKQIAMDLGASKETLKTIATSLKPFGHGGGTPGPGGGGPNSPGALSQAWGVISGVLSPTQWLNNLQVAGDAVGNVIGKVAGALGGGVGGVAGTVATIGVIGGGLLAALNALHVVAVRTTGRLGQAIATHAGATRGEMHDHVRVPTLDLQPSTRRSALGRALGNLEQRGGRFTSDLRTGAPWGMAGHPAAYLRQLPATIAGWGAFVPGHAVAGPVGGLATKALVDSWVDAKLGELNYVDGKYKHGVITRGMARGVVGAGRLATSPIDTMKRWFSTSGDSIAKDMNKVRTYTSATADATSKLGPLLDLTKLKGSVRMPNIAAIMDGTRAGLGGDAAAIGLNDAKGFAVRAAQNLSATVNAGLSNVKAITSDPGVRDAFTQKLQEAIHQVKSAGTDMQHAAEVQTKASQMFGENTMRGSVAEKVRARAATEALNAAHAQTRASSTIARAGERQSSFEARFATEEGKTVGRFGTFMDDFGSHIGRLGKIAGRFAGAVGIFELLPASFRKAIGHFTDTVTGAFKTAIADFGDVIKDEFKRAIGDFGHIIGGLRTALSHLPGLHGLAPASSAAADAAKVSKDAQLATGGEVSRLNKLMANHPQLQGIWDAAKAHGAKFVEIGGKIFSVAAKAFGVLAFLPAVTQLLGGHPAAAAKAAANAGSYFIPGVGEARIASDIVKMITGYDATHAVVNAGGFGLLGPKINKIENQIVGGAGSAVLQNYGFPADPAQQIAALKAFNALSVKEQQKFFDLSTQQRLEAFQDALHGKSGLETYLDTYANTMNTAFSTQFHITDKALKAEGVRIGAHLNAIQTGHVTMWTNIGGTTASGYQNVSTISAKYLSGLTKQIIEWEKKNGLKITSKGSDANVAAVAFGATGTALTTGAGINLGGLHHGGTVAADPHRVGPGRMVQMVEEGHPEVVIPLAPHRRDRARSLIDQTRHLIGYSHGGIVDTNVGHVNKAAHVGHGATALGDSISDTRFMPYAWPSVAHIDSAGVAGDGVQQTLLRLHSDGIYGGWNWPKGLKDRYRKKTVVLDGINDVFGDRPAGYITSGLTQIYSRLRRHGSEPVPVTLTPFGWSSGWSASRQKTHDQVNKWIMGQSGHVDITKRLGIGTPSAYRRGLGSPDNIHPSAAGAAAMASAIFRMAGGGYVNPIGAGAMPERIDMGVDYAGNNIPLYALGAGQITNAGAGTGGWGPSWINLRLAEGKYAGSQIYYAEHIKSLVKSGQHVKAGQHIANLMGGMEIGFASGSGNSTTSLGSLDNFTGGNSTAAGAVMSNLISSLGGPAGIPQGAISGKFKGGSVGLTAGSFAASPLHLKHAPKALDDLGVIGPHQKHILEHAMKSVALHMNKLSGPGTSPGGSLAGFSGGGNAAANEKLGRKMMLAFGFAADQWPALQKLWTQESGWSDTIMHNPNGQWLGPGNASGIPQADGHGNVYRRGDAAAQIAWGLNYIKSTYKTPAAAWAFENSHSPAYYAGGSGTSTFATDRVIGVHQGERVQSAGEIHAAGLTNKQTAMDNKQLEAIADKIETLKSEVKKGHGTDRIRDSIENASKELNEIKSLVADNAPQKEIRRDIKRAADTLDTLSQTAQKALLIQIAQQIKASGPQSNRLKNLIGSEIKKGTGPLGAGGTQAANQINNLIAMLHNIPTTVRVANKGKAEVFAIDTHQLADLKSSLALISESIPQVKAAINQAKADVTADGKLIHTDHVRLNKDIADHASKAQIGRDRIKLAVDQHRESADKAMEKLDARILKDKQTGNTADLKKAQAELLDHIRAIRKKIEGESHTVTSYHSLETDINKLAKDKAGLAADIKRHASKGTISAARKAVSSQTHLISKEEAAFTRAEEKKGVSKLAIEYAIKHVGSKDNKGLLSDQQLRNLPSALLKASAGHIGKVTHGGGDPQKTKHHDTATEKTAKAHHTTSKAHAKTASDHAKAATGNYSVALKHLGVATKHLGVSSHHSKTADLHLAVGKDHFKVSSKHQAIGESHLKVAAEHAGTARDHLKTSQVHLMVHQSHLKVSSDAASSAKAHSGKTENAQTAAAKSRDTHSKAFDKKTTTDNKHQANIEKQFETMISHLNNMANKVEKLNPTVQNNITVSVGGQVQSRTVQTTTPSRNR